MLADKDTAAPRTAMLGSPLLFALRMSRAVIISWLLAIAVAALLYGSLAKSTGQAFASSGALRKFTGNLTHVAQQQLQLAGTRHTPEPASCALRLGEHQRPDITRQLNCQVAASQSSSAARNASGCSYCGM